MKRIYHTWDKWECYPAGFYENKSVNKGLSDDDCRGMYADFLRDLDVFEAALKSLVTAWPMSCEHYLSNENMNRITWLGQAAVCHKLGIPSAFRGGFNLLTAEEQQAANLMALKHLNLWLADRGEPTLTLDEAQSKTEANLY